jgi:diacylglycerol O-acyltransferase
MQQLTGLDAAFLALETTNSTGHVGGVCVLDPKDAPAADADSAHAGAG